MEEPMAVGGRLVSPDEIAKHHQTAITTLDLLAAIEAQQMEAIETNQWWKLKLEPYQFAIIRDNYRNLDEVRQFFKRALEEYQQWLTELTR